MSKGNVLHPWNFLVQYLEYFHVQEFFLKSWSVVNNSVRKCLLRFSGLMRCSEGKANTIPHRMSMDLCMALGRCGKHNMLWSRGCMTVNRKPLQEQLSPWMCARAVRISIREVTPAYTAPSYSKHISDIIQITRCVCASVVRCGSLLHRTLTWKGPVIFILNSINIRDGNFSTGLWSYAISSGLNCKH